MTLPTEIPPHAWPWTLAGMALMAWGYTRPAMHWLKQLWWYMVRSKAESVGSITQKLTGERPTFNHRRAAIAGAVMYWCMQACFFTYTIASLLVFAGVAKNPPSPWEERTKHINPNDWQIVTDENTIYAVPKEKK